MKCCKDYKRIIQVKMPKIKMENKTIAFRKISKIKILLIIIKKNKMDFSSILIQI
jgi:hypothetical protein